MIARRNRDAVGVGENSVHQQKGLRAWLGRAEQLPPSRAGAHSGDVSVRVGLDLVADGLHLLQHLFSIGCVGFKGRIRPVRDGIQRRI